MREVQLEGKSLVKDHVCYEMGSKSSVIGR